METRRSGTATATEVNGVTRPCEQSVSECLYGTHGMIFAYNIPQQTYIFTDMKNERTAPEIKPITSDDVWISLEEVARILDLDVVYCRNSIRKGFLKGKISYRSVSGRNFKYRLHDVEVLLEKATVPARKL